VRAGTDRFNVGDIAAAEQLFRNALERNPTNPVAHFCIGNIMAMSGRAEEALGHFAKAEAADPGQFNYPLCQGKALRDMGKNDEAVAALRRAVALCADKAEAHAELGRALFGAGKFDAAIESLGKAVALAPDEVPTRYSLAMVLFRAGRSDKALYEGRKAAESARAAGHAAQAQEIEAAVEMMRKGGVAR
jgi:tetratricopeptide (TPR) repeat protein